MSDHTPTPLPWELTRPIHPPDPEQALDVGIVGTVDGQRYVIAEFFGQVDQHRFAPAYENAAHALHCVSHHDALLATCQAQHRAIDWLMARLIEKDPSFLPTKSPVWETVEAGHALMRRLDQSSPGGPPEPMVPSASAGAAL